MITLAAWVVLLVWCSGTPRGHCAQNVSRSGFQHIDFSMKHEHWKIRCRLDDDDNILHRGSLCVKLRNYTRHYMTSPLDNTLRSSFCSLTIARSLLFATFKTFALKGTRTSRAGVA